MSVGLPLNASISFNVQSLPGPLLGGRVIIPENNIIANTIRANSINTDSLVANSIRAGNIDVNNLTADDGIFNNSLRMPVVTGITAAHNPMAKGFMVMDTISCIPYFNDGQAWIPWLGATTGPGATGATGTFGTVVANNIITNNITSNTGTFNDINVGTLIGVSGSFQNLQVTCLDAGKITGASGQFTNLGASTFIGGNGFFDDLTVNTLQGGSASINHLVGTTAQFDAVGATCGEFYKLSGVTATINDLTVTDLNFTNITGVTACFDVLLVGDGETGLPSITFKNQPDVGFRRENNDAFSIVRGPTATVEFFTSQTFFNQQVRASSFARRFGAGNSNFDGLFFPGTPTGVVQLRVRETGMISNQFTTIDTRSSSTYVSAGTPSALAAPSGAALWVNSDNLGFLTSRLTTAQRDTDLASPSAGVQIYNTDINHQQFYDGITWRSFSTFSGVPDPLRLTDGSAGQPSYSFLGGTGTGMYRGGGVPETLNFAVDGSSEIVVRTDSTFFGNTVVLNTDPGILTGTLGRNRIEMTTTTMNLYARNAGVSRLMLSLVGNGGRIVPTTPIQTTSSGSPAACAYAFRDTPLGSSPGTGMWHTNATADLGLSVAGTSTLYMSGVGLNPYEAFVNPLTVGAIAAPSTSAVLDLTSTSRGLLLPRLTAAQAGGIVGLIDGLMVYVTSTDATFPVVGFYGREGGAWVKL
jgi:hypothetical protein